MKGVSKREREGKGVTAKYQLVVSDHILGEMCLVLKYDEECKCCGENK